jgi:hypothetical protein
MTRSSRSSGAELRRSGVRLVSDEVRYGQLAN